MLTKPVLLSIPAWDCTKNNKISFNSTGGQQVVGNKLVITDQETNEIVYEEYQESFQYIHIISEDNSLENGKYYFAQIQTFDVDENYSTLSDSVQFWCYTEPTIEITNKPENNIIRNSSYSFEFEYNQNESESLDFWNIKLFDSSDTLLSESGANFPATNDFPLELSYTFNGFNDNSSYSVQIEAQTVEKTILKSDIYSFTTDYENPSQFTILELSNNYKKGYVEIKSNVTVIDGKSSEENLEYINDGNILNLKKEDAIVYWYEGYSINDNYTINLWGANFTVNQPVFMQKSTNNDSTEDVKLLVSYREVYIDSDDNDVYNYFDLTVSVGENTPYVIMSNFIKDISPEDNLFLYIKLVDGLYDIAFEKVEDI